jgi:hypothetical protein
LFLVVWSSFGVQFLPNVFYGWCKTTSRPGARGRRLAARLFIEGHAPWQSSKELVMASWVAGVLQQLP